MVTLVETSVWHLGEGKRVVRVREGPRTDVSGMKDHLIYKNARQPGIWSVNMRTVES